jgi:hypothetical protein
MKLALGLSISLFFCTILFCPADNAESNWSVLLKNSASQEAWTARQTLDGGFIVGLTANVTREAHPGVRLVVVKTNSSGIVQWQKEYGRGRYVAIRQLRSGEFVALAEHPERIGTGIDSSMIIFMLDANGKVEWQQNSPSGFTPIGVEEGPDESIFVYGYSSQYEGAAFLIKLRTDGEIIWQKKFSKHTAACASFRITGDGNALFAFPGQLHEYHIYKLKLDGQIIWKRFYKTSIFAASTFQSLELTKDGGFVVSEGLPLVSKFDKNGNPVWTRFYSTATMAIVNSLVSDRNGNTLLVGQIGTVGGHPDLWTLKIDPSGNILWHKRLGRNFVDRASDVALTKDNRFIIAGELGRGQFAGWNAWLLKINQSGTVNNSCDFAVSNISAQIETPQLVRLPAVPEVQKANIQIQFASPSEGDWESITVFNCK